MEDAYAALTSIKVPVRQEIHRTDLQYLFTYKHGYQNIISSHQLDNAEAQSLHTDRLGKAIPAAQLNTWGISLSVKQSNDIQYTLAKQYYPNGVIIKDDLILRTPALSGIYDGIPCEGAILHLQAELKSPRRLNLITCDWLHPSLHVLYSAAQLQNGNWIDSFGWESRGFSERKRATYDYPVVMDDTIIRYRLILQQTKYDYHIVDDIPADPLPNVSIYHNSYGELPWLAVDTRKKYTLTWRYPFRFGDISLQYNVYEPVSVYVTDRLTLSGMPEKVALDADEIQPDGTDIEYYISADDTNWFPILPLSRDNRVTEFVPEVDMINNTRDFSRCEYVDGLEVQADGQSVLFTCEDNVLSIPYPDKSKWYTISYNTLMNREVPYNSTFIRLKVILRRLRKDANATPILRSFRLYVEHSTKYNEVCYSDEHNQVEGWSGARTT